MLKTFTNNKVSIKVIAQIFFWVCSTFIVITLIGCTAQNIGQNKKNDFSTADSLSLQKQLPDSMLTDSSMAQNWQSDSIDFADSAVNLPDSVSADSLLLDTTASISTDTLRISPNAVTSIVDYTAEDSVEFDIVNKKAVLCRNTVLLYEDIELKSNYVEIDFSKNELYSTGTADSDSIEALQGTPVFKQGEYEVKSRELQYNFTSKKGLLKQVITQEGESFLHGAIVKKNADNTSYIRYGKYTTCDLEHPHFEIDFAKGKVIPNDKIVTGPLYLRIANIPTFLALPFAIFPNTTKHKNGLLIPSDFPFDPELGFCIRGLGYYFAIKEIMDYSIKADIYFRGSFGIGVESNYVKRYKFKGFYNLFYQFTPKGERTTETRTVSHDFRFKWNHQQDRKAHPTNSFSASVDFKTKSIRDNAIAPSLSDYTQSNSSSSISFSTSFKSRYSLGINANISQNFTNGNLDLDLPQINFNISEFYPLRKKKTSGKLRWYEEISMQYNVNMSNGINTTDSILFSNPQEAFNTFRTSLNQYIPIKSKITLFKNFKWNNSISLREIWYAKGITQKWKREIIDTVTTQSGDSIRHRGVIVYDTNWGFFASHDLAYNSDLSTTLYGMYVMKKGKVYAFRHTFMPSVGFTYKPAINKMNYMTYYDSINNRETRYSIIISPAYKSSASVNFSINNRLEMKVRTKPKDDEDEEESFKKITILESFSIRTSYDFIRDSLRLDPVSINGRTTLFKYINLSFDFQLDPYAYDENSGVRVNVFEWNVNRLLNVSSIVNDSARIDVFERNPNRRLLRLSSTAWQLSCGLNINKGFFKTEKQKAEKKEVEQYGFKDWNVSLNYSFSYNMRDNLEYYYNLKNNPHLVKYTHEFFNTLNISGRVAITPKWGLSFFSGYDFNRKEISASQFTITRDLHCWEMEFIVKPFGTYRGFEFKINAKANIIKDAAKWEQKKVINDYY